MPSPSTILSLDRLPPSLPLELELPLPLRSPDPARPIPRWMDGTVAGVVVPVRLPDPVTESELEMGRENVDADVEENMNEGARELRFDESGDFDFLEEDEDCPGTASISGGIGNGDAARFLRDGCPGLGEG